MREEVKKAVINAIDHLYSYLEDNTNRYLMFKPDIDVSSELNTMKLLQEGKRELEGGE